MKTFAVFVMLFCLAVGQKVAADPMAVSWNVTDSKNATCFLATMGIEYNTMYNSSTDNKMHQAMILFQNETQFAAVLCNETMVKFTLMNTTADANLTLTYTSANKTFMLSEVMLVYIMNNETFPNATNMANVTLVSNALRFMTNIGMAYNCSLEADIRLEMPVQVTASENKTNEYIRLTPDMKKGLMMQAFELLNDTDYGKVQQCFADHMRMLPELGKWQVMNKDKNVCAMMYSVVALDVNYTTIAGKTMTTRIPLTNETMVSDMSVCGMNSTNITLSVEGGVGNLTFGFIKTMKEYFYLSDGEMFALDFVELVYDPKTKYFPNHEFETNVTVKQDKLDMFSAPVGSAFQCDVLSTISSNESLMMIMMNSTHIQPFNVTDSKFGNVSYCSGEPTPMPPQTTAPVRPDVDNPVVSDRSIKSISDNKTICLHAHIGLQIMTYYINKLGNKTEVLFNFDEDNCTTTANCSDPSKEFDVLFERKEYNLNLTLSFTKDEKTNTTYLSGVMLAYNFSENYPNGTDTSGQYSLKDLTQFNTSIENSYLCSTETDILLNATEMIILRITGVQLEPLPKSDKFAKASKCFSDLDVPDANHGSWFVNETDDKKAICAHFAFSATVNVTYEKLIHTSDPEFVVIPISNMTMVTGTCELNKTTLTIPMDDCKINFTFVFTKNMTSKTEYSFSMTEFMMEYDTDSKYFPNHAYVSSEKVMLGNSSLKLFKSDQDHSYLCNQKVKTTFNQTYNVLTMKDVQVQPFNVSKTDGAFSAADDCDSDLSPIIPIIVGSVLAGLVVVVIVAYIIGRRRRPGTAYETL